MATLKTHRFPVDVRWVEGKLTVASVPGKHELKVRAVNRIGQSQPTDALWNPPGYMRNVVETVRVTAA